MGVNSSYSVVSVAPSSVVQNQQQTRKKPIVSVKNTGYAAMGLLCASGFLAVGKKMKAHKVTGWAGLLLSALHMGMCLAPKRNSVK